jgi:hypothetical protein
VSTRLISKSVGVLADGQRSQRSWASPPVGVVVILAMILNVRLGRLRMRTSR